MKKLEKITQNIKLNKELMKRIESKNYYNVEMLIEDINAYIKAIKEGRMICVISSVSRSGMSRNIRFSSCEKGRSSFYYRNYNRVSGSLFNRWNRNWKY